MLSSKNSPEHSLPQSTKPNIIKETQTHISNVMQHFKKPLKTVTHQHNLPRKEKNRTEQRANNHR
jgi:hypothetical protein